MSSKFVVLRAMFVTALSFCAPFFLIAGGVLLAIYVGVYFFYL